MNADTRDTLTKLIAQAWQDSSGGNHEAACAVLAALEGAGYSVIKEPPPIDWEARRYEVAKNLWIESGGTGATWSVAEADKLIAALKEKANGN